MAGKLIYRPWPGYFEEYPEYPTQGESLKELQENLRDIYNQLRSGNIPCVRKVSEPELYEYIYTFLLNRQNNCFILQKARALIHQRINQMKTFNVIIERDTEGFYIASVPELKGCHTQAKSMDKLMERIKEAIELCVEVEDAPITTEFIGLQRIAVSI